MSELLTNRSRSTLNDVAQAAGVSTSTASLVLAGKAEKRRISEETHQKVHRAALALGYTPSLLHRSMRRGRTHVISFYNAFRNRDWSDLYMDQLAAGIEHAGGSFGYDVLAHCNYRRSAQETYEFLNGGFADGVILFGPSADDPLLPLLRASNLPTVVIGPRGEETELSVVRDDEEEGMRLVAESLLESGHRRIAAVVERLGDRIDPTGRLPRLRANLAAHGVELTEENVVVWTGAAPETLAKVVELPKRPTALFVWHDRAAYRLTEACAAAGIDVPGDLSIVGYDGLVWPSTTGHTVASATVSLPVLARTAVGLLDRLIEGEAGPFTQTIPISFHPGTTLGLPLATP